MCISPPFFVKVCQSDLLALLHATWSEPLIYEIQRLLCITFVLLRSSLCLCFTLFSTFSLWFRFLRRFSSFHHSIAHSLLSLPSANSQIAVSLELHSDHSIGFKYPPWLLWIILLLYVFHQNFSCNLYYKTYEFTHKSIIKYSIHTLTQFRDKTLYKQVKQLITYRYPLSHKPDLQYQLPPSSHSARRLTFIPERFCWTNSGSNP